MAREQPGVTRSSDRAQTWDDFARRVVDARAVWAVSTSDGLLGASGLDGTIVQPFWSSRRRVNRILDSRHPPLRDAKVVRIPLEEFVRSSLPNLVDSKVMVGVDWGTDSKGWIFDAHATVLQLRDLIRLRLN